MLKRNSVVTRQGFPATILVGPWKTQNRTPTPFAGTRNDGIELGWMVLEWSPNELIMALVFTSERLCTAIMGVFGQVAGFEGR